MGVKAEAVIMRVSILRTLLVSGLVSAEHHTQQHSNASVITILKGSYIGNIRMLSLSLPKQPDQPKYPSNKTT
jgi:hypothetical protein